MKSFIKTLSIALGSAVLSIFIYDFYFQPASEEIIKGNVGASLIPANYTYNSGNVAAELTDFTVAAEKTVHAVVHVKNTSSSSSDLPVFYRYFYGDDELPDRIGTGSGVIISPNGYIITINPVSWKYHEAPVDCWRIYPEGMKTINKKLEENICQKDLC